MYFLWKQLSNATFSYSKCATIFVMNKIRLYGTKHSSKVETSAIIHDRFDGKIKNHLKFVYMMNAYDEPIVGLNSGHSTSSILYKGETNNINNNICCPLISEESIFDVKLLQFYQIFQTI